jgi:glutamine synthetase
VHGLIVLAGLQGIREKLPTPPVLEQMPADLSDAEREWLGIRRRPGSLDEALELLEADDLARSWFSPNLFGAYVSLKRTEIRILEGLSPTKMCERYRNAY